jgi:hypothetical protein
MFPLTQAEPTEETDSERYRAPALDKGLDILELLSGVESGLTQAEMSKRLAAAPTNSIACSTAWCGAAMSPGSTATGFR